MTITCEFRHPNSNMDRTRWWKRPLLVNLGVVHRHCVWLKWPLLVNLDIQIRIWIESLANFLDFFLFGHPNVKMDRCKKNCTLTFVLGCPNSKMDCNPWVNAWLRRNMPWWEGKMAIQIRNWWRLKKSSFGFGYY